MNWFLDLLVPKFCVGCQKEGTYLCKKCARQILTVEIQTCPDCGRITEGCRYCQSCRRKYIVKIKKGKKTVAVNTLFLNGILTAVYYKEGPTKELIHNFKYNSVLELKIIFGKMLAETLKRNWLKESQSLITFVPLHPRRLAIRGYNQAEILALEAAQRLKIPCYNLLRKVKHTKRQVGLIGTRRRKNLEGVFRVRQDKGLKGKTIILVDDITTTGATLNECAKVLKAAGAQEVWGLVIAKG